MFLFHIICTFTVFLQVRCDGSEDKLYDFMNINCKDNLDMPVDWWYIYKPPRNTGPYFESGVNFTYILPNTMGRWKASQKFINSDSMLHYTLAPLYDKIYKKYLAVMSYGERHHFQDDELLTQKSTAYGVMIANPVRGIWIGHTVPGFPNFTRHRQIFPEAELSKGHLLMCLNVDLQTLNAITAIVRHTEPNILKFTLPDHMMTDLPEWTLIETAAGMDQMQEAKTKLLNIETRGKSLRGFMVARSPEDSHCLYKTFAKVQGLVLDVYSNAPYKQHPVCEEAYSLRHIDSISLKFPDQQIYYVNNKTDRTSFAVSTAALWQRTGKKRHQYWTCAGNIDHQSPFPPKGALIACVNSYAAWLAFDNLKVKEPSC